VWACKEITPWQSEGPFNEYKSQRIPMLNSQNLINKICACISGGGLTALQSCQLNGALTVLCAPVCSVATCSNLPDATTYVGRMIYEHAENRYYHAFDGCWRNDFQSSPLCYESLLLSWGSNRAGRLGDNTTTTFRTSPGLVAGAFTDWCAVSSAFNHTVALRTDGTLWSWGCNAGRLGDGTTSARSSPVSVVGGFSDWCQVGANRYHSVAVRSAGSLWEWGCNHCGQLGDNTTITKSSPVSVVGGFSDWCGADAGFCHTVAVRTSGSVWAWGLATYGQLGDNTNITRSSPVSVVGGFSDWLTVAAGLQQSAAVRSNGSAWAWGRNGSGELGDNTTTLKSSPVSVVGGFSDWCKISASNAFNIAGRNNGSLWGWGTNDAGQLGNGVTTPFATPSPAAVVGGFTDWCQASAGSAHSMAVRTNGTAWAWGTNYCGALGDNTTINKSSPVGVVSGFTDWCQVSAGVSSMAIRQKVKGF